MTLRSDPENATGEDLSCDVADQSGHELNVNVSKLPAVFVYGCNGFIGRKVCEKLRESNGNRPLSLDLSFSLRCISYKELRCECRWEFELKLFLGKNGKKRF